MATPTDIPFKLRNQLIVIMLLSLGSLSAQPLEPYDRNNLLRKQSVSIYGQIGSTKSSIEPYSFFKYDDYNPIPLAQRTWSGSAEFNIPFSTSSATVVSLGGGNLRHGHSVNEGSRGMRVDSR